MVNNTAMLAATSMMLMTEIYQIDRGSHDRRETQHVWRSQPQVGERR